MWRAYLVPLVEIALTDIPKSGSMRPPPRLPASGIPAIWALGLGSYVLLTTTYLLLMPAACTQFDNNLDKVFLSKCNFAS